MKKIIGITGGVGSGKSTVLNFLEKEYGAGILMADKIGHEAFEKDTETYKMIVDHFGKEILDDREEIDHTKLAAIIFINEKEKEYLNNIIHPYVLNRIKSEIENYDNLLIIETALMFETGCDKLCDEVWGVITDTDIRIERLIRDRGYSEEKARSIIRAQLSDEELKEKCTEIIINNTTISNTKNQIKNLFDSCKKTRKDPQ